MSQLESNDHPRRQERLPRVLFVADRPNWVYDRKARHLKSRLRNLSFDIGYVRASDPNSNWLRLYDQNRYQALWYLGFHMGRDDVNRGVDDLSQFVRHANHHGTAVVASVTNALMHFNLLADATTGNDAGGATAITLLEREMIERNFAECEAADQGQRRQIDLQRLRAYNGLAVNNKVAYTKLRARNLACHLVPDGVDLTVFRPTTPIVERKRGVIMVCSKRKQLHKGHGLFRQLTDQLRPHNVECRAIIGDSKTNSRRPAEMAELYNQYPIYLCASKAEGGPATLLEAVACGCVAVSTPVGYATELLGQGVGCIVRRRVEEFRDVILYLLDDNDLTVTMSTRTKDVIQHHSWDVRAEAHEAFLFEHLR